VKTFETKFFILLLLIDSIGMSMLSLHDFALGNNWFFSAQTDLFSVLDSPYHVLSVNFLLEIIQLNLSDIFGLHGFGQEFLHLFSLGDFGKIIRGFSLLLTDEISVDFHSRVWGECFSFFIFTVLLNLTSLIFISSKGQCDKDEEENEGGPGFPWFNDLIGKNVEEPDISKE